MWVANELDSTVSLIDPSSATVVLTRAVSGTPEALAAVGTGVWVAAGDTPLLTLLHASGGARTVELPSSATTLATDTAGLIVGVRGIAADHRGGTLVMRTSFPIAQINPNECCDVPPNVRMLAYDGLLGYSKSPSSIDTLVPDLALAVPAPQAGGRMYTFRLRPGLRYWTGAPVRATDVRRGLERAAQTSGVLAAYIGALPGAVACPQTPTLRPPGRGRGRRPHRHSHAPPYPPRPRAAACTRAARIRSSPSRRWHHARHRALSRSPYCPYTRAPSRAGRWVSPDLVRARQLVAASGTRGSSVNVLTEPGLASDEPTARYIVRLLRQLGYRARLRALPPKQRDTAVTDYRHPAQIVTEGWIADFPSASQWITQQLSCAAWNPPEQLNNQAEFCDPIADRWAARATRLQLTDPVAASHLWARADRRITNLAPWIPTVTQSETDLLSRRVGDYQYGPTIGALVDEFWVR